MNADDCCINNDDGLYYMDGSNCIQCVSKWLIEQCTMMQYSHILFLVNDYSLSYTFAAFGWMQSTFEGEEQSVAHIVQGGYSKGSGNLPTVDVFIELVQDPEAMFSPSTFIGAQLVCTY